MKTASQLRKFRQACERSAGVPASQISIPLLAVLTDICVVLKLSAKDRQHILGRRGIITLKNTQNMRIRLVKPADSLSLSEWGRE